MRIIVIPVDGFVSINGEGFSGIDLSFLDTSIHAIQWYGTEGEIERKNNRGNMIANEAITSFAPFNSVIDLWQAKKDEAQQASNGS